jgi:hypothetical protein
MGGVVSAYNEWYRRGYLDGLKGSVDLHQETPLEYVDSYRDGYEDGSFKRECEQEDAA